MTKEGSGPSLVPDVLPADEVFSNMNFNIITWQTLGHIPYRLCI